MLKNQFVALVRPFVSLCGDKSVRATALASGCACPAEAALVAHWKMDENAGQTAGDSVGTFNGQLGSTGGVDTSDPAWISPSKIGTAALDFNGSQVDHLEVAHDPALIEGKQMSISLWMKRSTTGINEYFICKGDGNSNETTSFWLQLNASNQFVYWLGRDNGTPTVTGSSFTTLSTLTDTIDWHHVAATYDGATKRIYLDGVEIGFENFAMTGGQIINETSLGLGIGRLGVSNAGGHRGAMDDVGMYTDALSAAEVNSIFTLGNHPALVYDLGQAQSLFDLHAAADGQLEIGDELWAYRADLSALGLTPGEVTLIGDHFYLLLSGTSGVATILPVPEPASLQLLGLGLLCLVRRSRRNLRKG